MIINNNVKNGEESIADHPTGIVAKLTQRLKFEPFAFGPVEGALAVTMQCLGEYHSNWKGKGSYAEVKLKPVA